MILADTSIWVTHLRKSSRRLAELLDAGEVLVHPWVVGELLLGGISGQTRDLLLALPTAATASETELLAFIVARRLVGSGIGYVDTQLLAATMLSPGTRLWTADRALRNVADRLRVAYRPT